MYGHEDMSTINNSFLYLKPQLNLIVFSLSKGLVKKSHESHNSRITLSTAVLRMVVISLPMTQSLRVLTRSLLGLQIFNFPSDL